MSSVLAIGIDPATHTGLALVRLDTATGEAELVGCWAVYGESWRAWCGRALSAAYALAHLADGKPVVGWWERPRPGGDDGWDPVPMATRAGAILMALQVAGVLAVVKPVNVSQWTAAARVPAGKQGDGSHRITEAAARIAFAGAELAVLEHCRIDCAEAALIALACARACAAAMAGGKQTSLLPARGGAGGLSGAPTSGHSSPRQE